MEDGPKPLNRPRSSITWAVAAAGLLVLLPFALLAIALLDDHVFHTQLPFKIYRALGIREPLQALYFWIGGLLGGNAAGWCVSRTLLGSLREMECSSRGA